MDKLDLIKKLQHVDGLTKEEKAGLINLVKTDKKYGLLWEEKAEDVEEQLRENIPVLQEIKELAIIKGDSYPNHILIEGDNLQALTALTFTHEGKVDVIYIDPPYNTGKEDEFRYNDKWVLKDNPFRHSLWINFISKRLKLARRLLSEEGVIIIHIDENEFDALNLYLETEVFGNENFLGAIIWNKQNPKGDAKGVAMMHEYVLVYAKNKERFTSLDGVLLRLKPNAETILNKAKKLFGKLGKREIPDEIKEVVKPFNFSNDVLKRFEVTYDLTLINKEFQSWLGRSDFSGGEKAYKFIDENGKVYRGVSMAWPNKQKPGEDYFKPLVHPITGKICPVPARGWRNPSSTMQLLLERNLILFGQDERKQPERKYFLEDNLYENTPSIFNSGASDDDLFKDLQIEFPYPKPVSVASYFLKSVHAKPKIILDFFAGSGTALHAAMQLNAEDGRSRQCILVTNNENNIAKDVCYKRSKQLIQGYSTQKGEQVPGLTNNNLRYYKTQLVSRERGMKNKRELVKVVTELLRIKEDCYDNCTTAFAAQKLSGIKLFTNGKNEYLCIIYDNDKVEESVAVLEKLVAAKRPSELIKVYVFCNGQYPFMEEFETVLPHVTLCTLPDAIYQACENVLRNREGANATSGT